MAPASSSRSDISPFRDFPVVTFCRVSDSICPSRHEEKPWRSTSKSSPNEELWQGASIGRKKLSLSEECPQPLHKLALRLRLSFACRKGLKKINHHANPEHVPEGHPHAKWLSR